MLFVIFFDFNFIIEIRCKDISEIKGGKGQNNCDIGLQVGLVLFVRLNDLFYGKTRRKGKENYIILNWRIALEGRVAAIFTHKRSKIL